MKNEVQNMVNHEENQVESTPCKLNISINEHDTFSIGKSANPDTYKLTVRQKIYRVLKAAMDFLIALVALIVISPLFLIVAIAIKLDSPGPVFFVQKRIGKNGKLFNCIKFRSMSVDARHDVAGYEYDDVQSYVTKVGAFIRKCSIDELPQFYNILTFKMSLIGYRPSQPCETELNEARENFDVLQLYPGISGWAQVNGRDILAAQPLKKAEYDAYYLKHFSLLLDIKIFFMTIVKVFKNDDIIEGVIETPQNETDAEFNKSDIEIVEVTVSDSAAETTLDSTQNTKQEEFA